MGVNANGGWRRVGLFLGILLAASEILGTSWLMGTPEIGYIEKQKLKA